MGVGIGMENTCKPIAVSFQCMTKSTVKKKKRNNKEEKNLTHKSASFRVSFHFPICVYHFTFLKTRQIPDENTDNLRDKTPHIPVLRLLATQTQSSRLI